MTLIEWLEGPLLKVTFGIFLVFAIWRIFSILATGRRRPEMPPQGSVSVGVLATVFGHFIPRKVIRNRSRTWFVTIAGYAFHLGLFTVLIAAQPHVAFIRAHIIDINLPVLPRWGFILAAEVAFSGLIALWIRRFIDPIVKFISRPDDHIASGLTLLVMFTGCISLAEQSVTLRSIHLGISELWLIYFPFSSLMHTFTWVLSRGYTGATAGRRGVYW